MIAAETATGKDALGRIAELNFRLSMSFIKSPETLQRPVNTPMASWIAPGNP
jgi:hypothetical protein